VTGSRAPVIEVFADIWCPFAHVGLRRFTHQRWATGRPDLTLHVRAWPLELVNGVPLDGANVAQQVADLRRQVTPHLFSGFHPERFPTTTLPALDLVSDAYAVGLTVGERASLAVRDLLFERGEDISDPRVLDGLRRTLGLPAPDDSSRPQLMEDWADGQRRGVIGSPHFFIGDEGFFCPALSIEREDGQRLVRMDSRRFDEFFARCAAA